MKREYYGSVRAMFEIKMFCTVASEHELQAKQVLLCSLFFIVKLRLQYYECVKIHTHTGCVTNTNRKLNIKTLHSSHDFGLKSKGHFSRNGHTHVQKQSEIFFCAIIHTHTHTQNASMYKGFKCAFVTWGPYTCVHMPLLSGIQAFVLGLKVSQWEVHSHVPVYPNPAYC